MENVITKSDAKVVLKPATSYLFSNENVVKAWYQMMDQDLLLFIILLIVQRTFKPF